MTVVIIKLSKAVQWHLALVTQGRLHRENGRGCFLAEPGGIKFPLGDPVTVAMLNPSY